VLRITIAREPHTITLRLEGKLAGVWVDELEHCWRSVQAAERPDRLIIDLSGVTFIDRQGIKLLARASRDGAQFYAGGVMNRCIIENIQRAQQYAHSVQRR